jgi:hypothetical protein
LILTWASPERFLRAGPPCISRSQTTVDFPAGDRSFLHAIPGIGSEFNCPESLGPAAAWSHASGVHAVTLAFRCDD